MSLSWKSSCNWVTNTDSSKTSNHCSWRRHTTSNHSTSVTRKEDCCAKKGVSARGGCDSSARCQTLNPTCSIPTSQRNCHNNKGNGECESGGAGRPSRGTAKIRTSTRPDHPAGAPSAYALIWREVKVPQQWEDAVITVRSSETTAASRSCPTRVRFF